MFHRIRVSRQVCVLAFVALLASLSVTMGLASGTWVTRAPMSVPRYASAAVAMGGQIHVLGGTSTYACSFLASHDVYNPATNTWTDATEAPMSVPRVGYGAVVLNGLLYAVGGNDRCSSELSSVEAYNPAANTWTPRASMSTPRSSVGVGVAGGRIFAVGGLHPSDGIVGMLATVEAYDPVTNAWTPQPSLPHGLYNMGIGVIADVLYVAGGATPSGLTTEVYAFDPATPGAGWVPKAPMPVARNSANFSSVAVGDRLYVLGHTAAASGAAVDIYDPATNSWTTGTALPANVFYPTVATVNGQVYSFGGISGSSVPLAATFLLEVIPPATTASLSPSANANGWNNGNVLVTLNATAPGTATVTSVAYSLSGAQAGSATVAGNSASFTVSAEGVTTVTYHAVDSLGNVEANQVATVRIDRMLPVITPILDQTILADSPAGGTFVFTPTATDIGGSGVVSVTASHAGPLFPTGETTVTLNAMDAAGNGALPVTFRVEAEPALVSLAVTPSEATILSGATQQFMGVAHFSDGSTQATAGDGGGDSGGGDSGGGPGGGGGSGTPGPLWSIEFMPSLDPGPCWASGSGGFGSQAFTSNATTGAVDVVWSPLTPAVHVVGTLTPESQFTATLTCTNGHPLTGSITGTWAGPTATRFTGTYSLGTSVGSVVIKGWSSKASIPQALFSIGAVEAGGKLYAIGGADSVQDGYALNQIYDPATNSWSTDTPMPTARKGMGVATLGGKIYAVGGIQSGSPLTTVEVYDPVLHTWASAAPLSHARARFALVNAGGRLYAIGGETGFGGAMADVERYDPIANTWVDVAPLPEPRSSLAGGALHGGTTIIAAAGGTTGSGSGGSRTPYLYDVASDEWREGPSMLFQIGLAGGAVVGNAFYVWGHDSLCLQPGQVFVPGTFGNPDGWALLAPMPTKRSAFGIASIGDVIYAIGGQPSGHTQIVTLESYSATPSNYLLPQPSEPPMNPCGGGGGSGGGDGGDDGPTWRVLDETVASIDQNGLATGLNPGVTTVVIEYGDVSCLATSTCATLTVDTDTVEPEPALVSLAVTPPEATILSGATQQFIGIGHFDDGSIQTTEGDGGGGDSGGGSGGPGGGPGGGTPHVSPRLWAIEFPAGLNHAPCGVATPPGLFTQAFDSDASTGAVDVVWPPFPPTVRAVGTLTPESQFNATLTCTNGNVVTGTISATWSGPNATRFLGTYSFGGVTGNVVVKGWSPKPSMPQARFALGAAAAGGKLYAIGGGNSTQLFDLNQVYDPATNSWSTAAPMPMAREGMGVAALGGRIYVAGGNAGGSVHSRVDVFDPATGSWDDTPADLLHARAHFALVSTGAALYAIGGETSPGFGGVMASVERYDPGPNTWTDVAPLPEPRAFLAGGAINGGTLIIVAGGGGAGGARSPTPYVYDLPAGTWRTGPPMMFTVGVVGGAVIDNGFYLWTGGPCAQAGQVFVPEIVTPQGSRPEGWSYLAPMRVARGEFGIAAVGDVIYAAGGQTADGAIDALESYTSIPWHHFATQPPGTSSPCGGPGDGDDGGDGDGDDGPTWRVLDETVASIDQNGLATGLTPGVTTVVIEFGDVSCLATSTCATLTVDTDTDGDGTGNTADLDDDGDGVPDVSDAFPLNAAESVDADGDGTGDNADLDDDNDGTPDATDAFPLNAAESVDTDSDGTGNNADLDDDNDGTPDAADAFPLNAAESVDTDSDGTGDNVDLDDDNDGTPDATDAFPLHAAESVDTDSDGTGNNADLDDDNDGTPDATDTFPLNAAESVDTDSDGTGNNADLDDDGDDVPDVSDRFPLDATESVDTDSDGTGNNADLDDDNDDTPDATDTFPLNAAESVDTDSDGTGNNADPDDDGDGVLDVSDRFPLNAAESTDADGDGTGDNADLDDDNDGTPDATDAFPLNAAESTDADGDGTGDNADLDDDNDGTPDATDAFPLNAAESVDTDGDGTGNNADPDDDGDGVLDVSDRFPLNAAESVDTDNDGTGNNADPDDDGDGVLDVSDRFPLDATESVDTDSDGTGNNADPDDDGDGVPDVSDRFPLNAAESVDTDSDGTGNNADPDDDGDGVPDVSDRFPLNAAESVDTDSDGTGNNADPDDDGDGVPDVSDRFPLNAAESVDTDGDGIGNNADANDDNDGFADAVDGCPLVAGPANGCPAGATIATLSAKVKALALPTAAKTVLSATLSAASTAIARGNPRTAQLLLRAFVLEVRVLERRGLLSGSVADALADDAQAIANGL